MKKLFIVGAGGFGREMYAWLGQHPDCGRAWTIAGFLDDNPEALKRFGDFAPVSPIAGHCPSVGHLYVCGLGLPAVKEKLIAPLLAAGAEFLTFVHPTAVVGARVRLGRGTVLCPGAVVSCDITLGEFTLINLNSTVGHDATVGNWTSLSAQCDVTGHVKVGDRVFMGSKSTIIPSKTVGSRVVIGAGAVVIKDVPPGVTVVGNPARIL
jgi:sugar O-acyltransferase (sialic acid O-acetyltransferase NeuD family)